MRHIDDITLDEEREFLSKCRLLHVVDHENFHETVVLLHRLVQLAEKNMPVKSFFDCVRWLQGLSRLKVLGQGLNDIYANAKGASKESLKEALNDINHAYMLDPGMYGKANIEIDPVFDKHPNERMALLNLLGELRPLTIEDEFAAACMLLQGEISRAAGVVYLKGESPDYQETKLNRVPVELNTEDNAKELAAYLAKTNHSRGKIEVGMIESGIRKLGHLHDLYLALPQMIAMRAERVQRNEIMRTIKIGVLQERMTVTDYHMLLNMARRDGRSVPLPKGKKEKEKERENLYPLKAAHHRRIQQMAKEKNTTPTKILNQVLTDFFAVIDRQD